MLLAKWNTELLNYTTELAINSKLLYSHSNAFIVLWLNTIVFIIFFVFPSPFSILEESGVSSLSISSFIGPHPVDSWQRQTEREQQLANDLLYRQDYF